MAGETVDDVIGAILQRLEARGFVDMAGEEVPPPMPTSMN
jgi:hypothetical protein